MKRVLLWLIRFYQRHLSPLRKPCCIFIPTCSEYGYEVIARYGAIKGGWLTLKRLCRCHPFHGKHFEPYDPVP